MTDLPIEIAIDTTLEPVLVVEDNRLNQMVLMLLLERLGMAAEVAKNGIEALDAVKRQRYSIILMDCHMPLMDGFEATQEIRNYETLSGTYTPIIAVTALTTPEDRQRCLEVGMDDYLPKPIERELLKAKIDQWLMTSIAFHNPGSASLFRDSIVQIEEHTSDQNAVNIDDLREFYGEKQLSKMLQSFLLETEDKLNSMETFIKAENINAVSILATELKAKCSAIGARQLAKLCLYQQMAAVKNDWVEAQETFCSLQRSFAHGRNLFQTGVLTEENRPLDEADLAASEMSELHTMSNIGDTPKHIPH
jgi:CheY-like chemotaxis protein